MRLSERETELEEYRYILVDNNRDNSTTQQQHIVFVEELRDRISSQHKNLKERRQDVEHLEQDRRQL